ncbi:glutamate racemase [Bacillaceae bacterium W0354]
MERPIGVIDSGVGGLTVLHELKRQLPKEQFIYIGDTLRCPYGSKEKEEVIKYTWEMVQYLLQFNIKMLVVACNTATALVIDQLKEHLTIPVVGVIEPGARAAIKATNTNHIAIIGTTNTIYSRAYVTALQKINSDIMTTSIACPKFVPMIEQGNVYGEEPKAVVEEALNPLKLDQQTDTLILGCTHYPIIQPIIEEVVGEKITVLSSAVETGLEVSTILTYHNMLSKSNENQDALVLTTGDMKLFLKIQEEILHFKNIQLKHIKLQ